MTPADLADAVLDAVRGAVDAGDLAVPVPRSVTVERPKVREHGDYATTVALQLAKPAGRSPRDIAALLAQRLREHPAIASVDVAGPGFLNLRLAAAATGETARTVVRAGPSYAVSDTLAGQRLNLEFVSANPTGPLHLGHVRWAAVGDALARVLGAAGATVTREYYFNDAGAQIDRFAESLAARARGEELPENGYGGAYVADIAQAVVADHPELLDRPRDEALVTFRRDGLDLMFAEIKRSLAEFHVHFDVYFSERTLHDQHEVEAALGRLREQGHVEDRDGAVWLRTTDFGDDKDRVLVKSDGATTYFAADCAYYLDKRRRGADRVVIMLGADHHGYVGRMRAMAACFGDDPDATLELLVGQLVNVVRDGEPVRMSKRLGTGVTLEELLELVGADAARYTLARSSVDTMLDLDVDLLTRQSSENPVFYVQYVAARAAGILRNAAALGVSFDLDTVDIALLTHEREGDLLRALAEFPAVVATAAELRAVHRIARYLEETVAPAYHRFYDSCQVLPRGDEPPEPLHAARLLLVEATRCVVTAALDLLGVDTPDRM